MDAKLYTFCKKYFSLVGATLHAADDFAISVELPKEVDKELTDRPFYWMWIETLRETPPPSFLYLLFDDQPPSPQYTNKLKEQQKPERVLAGSYRMQKIYQSTKTRGMFAVVYEQAPLLWPCLLINVKVSFISDRKIDEIISYLLYVKQNTLTKVDMAQLAMKSLVDERPKSAEVFAMPINFDNVFTQVMDQIKCELETRDHHWAQDSSSRLKKELFELDHYYDTLENAEANEPEKTLRKAEITWRMTPRIEVQPFQLALLYLADEKV